MYDTDAVLSATAHKCMRSNVNVDVAYNFYRSLHHLCMKGCLAVSASVIASRTKPETLTSNIHSLNIAQEGWKLFLLFL